MNSLKFYELDDEGLRQMARLKKERLFDSLKYSMLGTLGGFTLAYLAEIAGKKMEQSKLDLVKTGFFLGTLGFVSYQGYRAADHKFKLAQKELIREHGSAVEEDL